MTTRKRSGSWGGARAPGLRKKLGPSKQNIHLDTEAARSLRILTLNARGVRNRPDLTEDAIVMELIEQAWRQLEREYSQAAEPAYEGGIL